MTTVIIIVFVAIGVLLLVRTRRQGTQSADAEEARPQRKKDTTYHAVSIKFNKNACQAAKEMTGRRFLATAAPRLPLPECNVAECTCRFAHHDDRRSNKDRRSPFGPSARLSSTGEFEREQRAGKDRRKSDFDY